MVSIKKLKKIREKEANLFKDESLKIKKFRVIDNEKKNLMRDIKNIRAARNRYKKEGLEIIENTLKAINKGTKKAGGKVVDYLYAMKSKYKL